MQKKGARYLRFSDDSQTVGSLDRQDIVTANWCRDHNVIALDTFKDDGYSARTFDRPDVKKLLEFIKRNHKVIDYLVVAELSRFSRDLGGAVTMVKEIQVKYNVQIVSCTWNQIYDITEANSLMMMGIEFTLANVDNLIRTSNTKGGIYAAKTGIKGVVTGNEVGRWVHGCVPLGYKKMQLNAQDKFKHLVIDEQTSPIVIMIFDNYLKGVPITTLLTMAREMGYKARGKVVIQKVLANPVYKGFQHVEAWKNNPGGLFKGNWEPIIDNLTWQRAHEKLNANKAKGISLNENYPLKNVLHCWCGLKLTAAPSKGRNNYYDYYKCNHSRHNNLSAKYAHTKLEEMLHYLSLPDYLVDAIREESLQQLDVHLQDNKKELKKVTEQLEIVVKKIYNLEEKFISNQVNAETYNRWNGTYGDERLYLQAQSQTLSKNDDEIYLLLQNNLEALTDMNFEYRNGTLIQKQQLLNVVFDNQLYVRDKKYRTTYLMEIFKHNELILNEKQLLFIDKKGGFLKSPPLG